MITDYKKYLIEDALTKSEMKFFYFSMSEQDRLRVINGFVESGRIPTYWAELTIDNGSEIEKVMLSFSCEFSFDFMDEVVIPSDEFEQSLQAAFGPSKEDIQVSRRLWSESNQNIRHALLQNPNLTAHRIFYDSITPSLSELEILALARNRPRSLSTLLEEYILSEHLSKVTEDHLKQSAIWKVARAFLASRKESVWRKKDFYKKFYAWFDADSDISELIVRYVPYPDEESAIQLHEFLSNQKEDVGYWLRVFFDAYDRFGLKFEKLDQLRDEWFKKKYGNRQS